MTDEQAERLIGSINNIYMELSNVGIMISQSNQQFADLNDFLRKLDSKLLGDPNNIYAQPEALLKPMFDNAKYNQNSVAFMNDRVKALEQALFFKNNIKTGE